MSELYVRKYMEYNCNKLQKTEKPHLLSPEDAVNLYGIGTHQCLRALLISEHDSVSTRLRWPPENRQGTQKQNQVTHNLKES